MIVHTPLRSWSLAADAARAEYVRGGAFQRNLNRFGHALFEQMAQTAVCSRQHRLDDRLCRWLLLALDRLEGPDIPMTQAAIAQVLGIRRPSVSECAERLEREGLVERGRGRLRVPDRAALEARACACYGAIRAQYQAPARAPGSPDAPA
ncbi:MAG: helix-turn-helix domain-containing protein [Halofilum sp. (in: g-proteobacteria)]|nr:helix-turn-helix domain-containing protein [Halofilum sp. (in: g-proteobacteria)]